MLHFSRIGPWKPLTWFVLFLAGAVAARAAVASGFDPVAETEALLATLPADQRARSNAYFEGGYWLHLWDLLITLVLAWALLRFGVAQRLRDWAERACRRRYVQGLLFLTMFVPLMWALNLPWDLYANFIREHAYGLSNLSLGGWFDEGIKNFVVNLIIFSLVGSLLYVGIHRFPWRWWVAGAVAAPFLLFFLLVIAPVFIAPLFNTYRPLTDALVRDSILSMARANGVPADNVYEFDASKQTKRISANLSGAFNTIRFSLNDNLLNRCTPAEVQAAVGHELGHYVLNHVYKLVIYQSLLIGAGFAFTHWFYGVVSRRQGAGWGLRGVDDFAGLPLLVAAFSLFLFLATPFRNAIVRSTEEEADIFGLNAARQPDAFATIALKLAEYRKLTPGRWEEILFFDHPSGRSRILMAMRWKAEHLAEPGAPAPPGSK